MARKKYALVLMWQIEKIKLNVRAELLGENIMRYSCRAEMHWCLFDHGFTFLNRLQSENTRWNIPEIICQFYTMQHSELQGAIVGYPTPSHLGSDHPFV